MEVVLQGAEGIPEGSVLSIKAGGIKQQALAGKIGQPFRFSSSPAEPGPLKVELLLPAAPPQMVKIDPASPMFEVAFGSTMKVQLQHREDKELRRDPVDISGAAEGRGLPAEKLQMAQKAAKYMEEHDLVHTFQEILHGLLKEQPKDPYAYVEERVARSKRLAAAARGEPLPPLKPESVISDEGSQLSASAQGKRSKVRASMRESTSFTKIETLMMTLQSASDNLPIVMPFLPVELREALESPELEQECKEHFKSLDSKGAGLLAPLDLVPIIIDLSTAKQGHVTEQQCAKFVEMFDSNDDAGIDLDEFKHLCQFVIVAGYLESDEGRQLTEEAFIQENAFQDFIAMIEEDKERLWSIIPFLPEWLVQHLTSEEFQKECHLNFDELDVDKSGSLEPVELIKVVQTVSSAHPLTIDISKCEQFTRIFDTLGNGVIMREEFVEFAQFMTVMSYLSNTEEGQYIRERAELENQSMKLSDFIITLEDDPSQVDSVLYAMPKALVVALNSIPFDTACKEGFAKADVQSKGALEPQALFACIGELTELLQTKSVDPEMYKVISTLFDRGKTGIVAKDDFWAFARYAILMSFLYYSKENQDDLVVEVLMGSERIAQLLEALRENVDRIADVLPFVPADLKDELSSPEFVDRCNQDFLELDADGSGVLEPRELLPIVLALSEAHQYSLTPEHCQRFVDIFDVERNGVITKAEYVNFARFMMLMAFMQTEEGQVVAEQVGVVEDRIGIDDLLTMLEKDRSAVQKVIPLLPTEMYNELTSDKFIMDCKKRFDELDQDRTGVLRPPELFPLIMEMSSARPYAVTEEQCRRFAAIFDIRGDGVLHEDEYLDFARFLLIMSFLHSDAGVEAKDALRVLQDSKKIDDLIETMKGDRQHISKVLPYLPEWLRKDLISGRFTSECLEAFSELDKDGNGSLEPQELYPLIQSMVVAHEMSLDMAQCQRFTDIFDDAKTGVISKDEFVNFARFLIVMNYLQSQEGQAVVEAALSGPQDQFASTMSPSKSQSHLTVDIDFYREKASKLTDENEALRGRLFSLENLMRKMEEQMEEQEQRLRHAEVDLRAAQATAATTA